MKTRQKLKLHAEHQTAVFDFAQLQRDLLDLNLNPASCTDPWRKAFDMDNQTVLLYQLDLLSSVPRIKKAIRVKSHGNILIPTVFINDQPLGSTSVASVIKDTKLTRMNDLNMLIERVGNEDILPSYPDQNILLNSNSVESCVGNGTGLPVSELEESQIKEEVVEQVFPSNSALSTPSVRGLISNDKVAPPYWKKNTSFHGLHQVSLHPSYDVYIYKSFLDDLRKQCGPAKNMGWKEYASGLVVHLLGGPEAVRYNNYKFRRLKLGLDRLLGKFVLEAVLAHIQDEFNLREKIPIRFFQQLFDMSLFAKKFVAKRKQVSAKIGAGVGVK